MDHLYSFKPYYKWITFNTYAYLKHQGSEKRFKPYYKWITFNTAVSSEYIIFSIGCFKPYYKWITFNTIKVNGVKVNYFVLNLIINGLPSIQRKCKCF